MRFHSYSHLKILPGCSWLQLHKDLVMLYLYRTYWYNLRSLCYDNHHIYRRTLDRWEFELGLPWPPCPMVCPVLWPLCQYTVQIVPSMLTWGPFKLDAQMLLMRPQHDEVIWWYIYTQNGHERCRVLEFRVEQLSNTFVQSVDRVAVVL